MDKFGWGVAINIASFVLMAGGLAELIGGAIKERGNWEFKTHAVSFLRILFGIVLLIIAIILTLS